FAELPETLRSGGEAAELNGNSPWLFLFREAWLRTTVFDFEGARKLCADAIDSAPEYPTSQPQTIARLAAGHAELGRGRADAAATCFREILDPEVTPKFFLHLYWRMNGRVGLGDAWLLAGERRPAHAGGG